MQISLTGISYLILSFAMALLAFRFLQYWQQRKDKISKLFFIFIFIFFLFAAYKALVCLFFVHNPSILASSVFSAVFLEGLAAAIGIYLAACEWKLSRFIADSLFFTVFIFGLLATWITSFLPLNPFLEGVSVNWGLPQPLYYALIRLAIILIAFMPITVLFIQQLKKTNDPIIKKRAIGFGWVVIMGVILAIVDFAGGVLRFPLLARDIVISLLGVFLFIVIYLTQKFPSRKNI